MIHDIKAWPRLREGKEVAAKATPSSPAKHAWVAVYPIPVEDVDSIMSLRSVGDIDVTTRESINGYIYKVQYFEIDDNTINNDYDVSEDEMEMVRVEYVPTLEALATVVSEMGLHLEDLDSPWAVEYPL